MATTFEDIQQLVRTANETLVRAGSKRRVKIWSQSKGRIINVITGDDEAALADDKGSTLAFNITRKEAAKFLTGFINGAAACQS